MTDETQPGRETEALAEASQRSFTKTPLFTANHAVRYQRQVLIKQLEAATGRTLLCFVGGDQAGIERGDTAGFVDLLHNVQAGDEVDLLLHSVGGDVDAAEKLIRLVRAKVGEDAFLRIIVPDFAKSAATLMALGADRLVMSNSSELGAIDPQFVLHDGGGNEICYSVLVYLEAYEEHAKALRADRDDPVAQLMFDKFNPVLERKLRGIRDRTRTLAENLAKRRGRNFSLIVSNLMDIKVLQSHGQMVSAEEAVQFGLDVEIMPAEDSIWCDYWQLYCLLALGVKPSEKIFESRYVSLVVG